MSDTTELRVIARVRGSSGREAEPIFCDQRRLRDPINLPAGLDAGEGAILYLGMARDGGATDVTVIAEAGSARADLYDQLERLRINPLYPPEVMAEVDAALNDPGIDDPALADLTHLPFVTIDNEDSRDLDQALHIERQNDTLVVRYALADAAYFVRPGTALFDEALERGASYYLPAFAVPMLPPALSEGLISLNPKVDRRALVFTLTLADDGELIDTNLGRARIRSHAKLSYNGVQAWFDDPSGSPLPDPSSPFEESLRLMQIVGERRAALAHERDVLVFDRSEVEVMLADQDGERFAFHRETRNDVSLWNEQISLLCNIAGARLMTPGDPPNPEVQAVFRVHMAPTAERLTELREILDAIVAHHSLEARTWGWRAADAKETLADYLARLPHDPETLAVRQAIERQILISNRRSTFSSEPGRHYALGVAPYGRFSAPMREIVGIFTHKEALELLGAEPPHHPIAEDEKLRERVIDAANRSKQRQGRLTGNIKQRAVSRLLGRDVDRPLSERPIYEGTILGIRATRLYVRLDTPPVEIKVYTDRIAEHLGCDLPYRSGSVVLRSGDGRASFAVGDRIRLQTHSADPESHRWYLVPVDI